MNPTLQTVDTPLTGICCCGARAFVNKVKQEQVAALAKDVAAYTKAASGVAPVDVSDPDAVLDGLAEGKLTAEQVLVSVVGKAIEARETSNCLTETFFSQGLEDARACDADEKKGQQQQVRGIPISTKDCVGVKGTHASFGVAKYATGPPAAEDCAMVRVLREEGAVLYTKTNVPQLMLSFECSNPLWGRTLNPYNPNFTCGGSSGGEAALIAQGGSLLGVGTDIGGSMRTPAHFCGIRALKPTSKRVTKVGFTTSVNGQTAIPGVAGPMSRSTRLLELFMQAVCQPRVFELDPAVVPIPWRREVYLSDKKLTIGYYTSDGYIPASPACQHAVQVTVDRLKALGHTVVEFVPPNVNEAIRLYYSLVTADGLNTMLKHLEGQEVHEDYVSSMSSKMRLPRCIKSCVSAIFGCLGWNREAHLLDSTGERTVTDTWRLQEEQQTYQLKFHRAWRGAGLDALVAPVHVFPATAHDSFKDISFAGSYTFLFNLLNYPAVVVPATHVLPTDVLPDVASPTPFDKLMRKHYDAEKAAGLPAGVQIAGQPFQEELLLGISRQLEAVEE